MGRGAVVGAAVGACVGFAGRCVAADGACVGFAGQLGTFSGARVGVEDSCVADGAQFTLCRYGQPVKPNCEVGASARAAEAISNAQITEQQRYFLNI